MKKLKSTKANAGLLKDTKIKTVSKSVDNLSTVDVHFKVKGRDLLYCDVYAYPKGRPFGDFSDDIGLEIIRLGGKKKSEELIVESDLRGSSWESAFAILPKGKYVARVAHKQNLDGKKAATHFNLEFDSKTFKKTSVVPNDPLFPKQWHLLNIGQSGGLQGADTKAVEAWKNRTDASNVVVAVIDGGVDVDHPDLDDNLWINKKEIPNNGIDDDKNGYIDDVHGWNFVKKISDPYKDKHGTHVAGIIGAEGDNKIGVSGIAWDTQLMTLDIFDKGKTYSDDNLIEAVNYAIDNGADVINMSLGYTIPHASLDLYKRAKPEAYKRYLDVFSRAIKNGVTIVAAAGNDDAEDSSNLSLPSAFSSEINGFISVAAVDHDQFITDYSNYGGEITIAAPGGSSDNNKSMVFSTLPLAHQRYGGMPGTSMAAPVVTGAVALVLAENKKLTPSGIETLLKHTAYKETFLKGYVQSGNLLDLDKSLQNAKGFNPKRIKDKDQNGSKLTSGQTLSVPYDELAYTDIAKRLWKNSGKDKDITYRFSDNKVSSDSVLLSSCEKSFVTELLEEIGGNTSLSFKQVKGKKSDFIIGGQAGKSGQLSLSETRKGISFSWPFDNNPKCKKPISSWNKERVTRDLGWALGLQTLDEKSEFKYTLTDSAMAWDYENDFNGFTSTDYAVINEVWSSF